ncbi:MAG: hypothetical protein ACM3PV_14205 [Betaproteobacteria bacterium]
MDENRMLEVTDEKKTLDRRQFTLAAALAALSGVAITISACGGSSSSPSSPTGSTGGTGSSGSTDKVGQISNNHGHSAVITGAQLTAGGALELNIQGAATHPHTVSLTGAEIASIAANQRVAKDSSTNNGHSHTVTFN